MQSSRSTHTSNANSLETSLTKQPMRAPSVKKHVSERSLTLEQGVMYTLGEYTVDVGDKTLVRLNTLDTRSLTRSPVECTSVGSDGPG